MHCTGLPIGICSAWRAQTPYRSVYVSILSLQIMCSYWHFSHFLVEGSSPFRRFYPRRESSGFDSILPFTAVSFGKNAFASLFRQTLLHSPSLQLSFTTNIYAGLRIAFPVVLFRECTLPAGINIGSFLLYAYYFSLHWHFQSRFLWLDMSEWVQILHCCCRYKLV